MRPTAQGSADAEPTYRELSDRLEQAERRVRLYRALYESAKVRADENADFIDELLSWDEADHG